MSAAVGRREGDRFYVHPRARGASSSVEERKSNDPEGMKMTPKPTTATEDTRRPLPQQQASKVAKKVWNKPTHPRGTSSRNNRSHPYRESRPYSRDNRAQHHTESRPEPNRSSKVGHTSHFPPQTSPDGATELEK